MSDLQKYIEKRKKVDKEFAKNFNTGYWNHRVICKKDKQTKEISYQIHEVYYSKKGKIECWTENPVTPYGESKNELKKDLKYFQNAFKYPILKEKKKGKKLTLIEI